MRFVRIFAAPASGEPVHVLVSETPVLQKFIGLRPPPATDSSGMTGQLELTKIEGIDLGLVDEFDPVALDGSACSHASHIFQRIEKHPLADTHPDAPKVRFKPEHKDVPRVHFCPCDKAGIEAHLKANGHDRLSSTAHAWLATILPPHEAKRLGLGRGVQLAHIKALEKARRGQVDGGRVFNFEREIQQRADAAAEKRTRKAQPIEAENG